MGYDGMTCRDCERPFSEVMDFLVDTATWNYVMADVERTTYTVRAGLFEDRLSPRVEGVGGVVCLACFDKRARDKGIEYRDSVVVLGVDCWMGGHFNGPMPLPAGVRRSG